MKRSFLLLMSVFFIYFILSSCTTLGKKDENPPVVTVIQANTYMSPNLDGIQDELILKVKVADEGFIKYWKLEIYDQSKQLVRIKQSNSNIESEKAKFFNQKLNIDIPETITWDGKDDAGNVVPDGEYYYQFFAMDNKKNITPRGINLGKVYVDNQKPDIQVKNEQKSYIFSPDGDGNKDELIIDLQLIKAQIDDVSSNQDATQDKIIIEQEAKKTQFIVEILDNQDQVVKTVYFNQPGAVQLKWNGKDDQGSQVADGVYKIRMTTTDKAGNSVEKFLSNIFIKTGETPVFVTLSETKISPNGDDLYDTIDINIEIDVKAGIETYQLDIINENKQSIRTFKGEKEVPQKITWDGKKSFDQEAKDGVYSAQLVVSYNNGNQPRAESEKFILDNSPPIVEISTSPAYFSPDNDGMDDELILALTAKDFSGISYWRIDILTPDKEDVFKSFSGEGSPADKIIWNGLSDDGKSVGSAEDYPVKVAARDNAGNKIEKEFPPIMVDILVERLADGRLKIRVSNIQFLPNSGKMTKAMKNKKVLDLLGKALRKYRQYTISIEGHANRFKKDLDEKKAKDLSELRADNIALELAKRGIPKNRMSTIGKGFDEPLVALDDVWHKNLPKDEIRKRLSTNRRVEFYLKKQN